jgi:hypothetical protein
MKNRFFAVVVALSVFGPVASAACVNRFVTRQERSQQIVTLLTGKLTFQEAQSLAKDIAAKTATPLEWTDDKGKTIARQFGELKIVRPMPVGCDGRSSGVVLIVTFPSAFPPTTQMHVKIKDEVVRFEQQAN